MEPLPEARAASTARRYPMAAPAWVSQLVVRPATVRPDLASAAVAGVDGLLGHRASGLAT